MRGRGPRQVCRAYGDGEPAGAPRARRVRTLPDHHRRRGDGLDHRRRPEPGGLPALSRRWRGRGPAGAGAQVRFLLRFGGAGVRARPARAGDPRLDPPDRVGLRRQPGPVLGRRRRPDAVPALDLGRLRRRCRRRRRRPIPRTPPTRSTRRRQLPARLRRARRLVRGDLRLQPRRLVRDSRSSRARSASATSGAVADAELRVAIGDRPREPGRGRCASTSRRVPARSPPASSRLASARSRSTRGSTPTCVWLLRTLRARGSLPARSPATRPTATGPRSMRSPAATGVGAADGDGWQRGQLARDLGWTPDCAASGVAGLRPRPGDLVRRLQRLRLQPRRPRALVDARTSTSPG